MIRDIVNPWHPDTVQTGQLLAVVRHPAYVLSDARNAETGITVRTVIGCDTMHEAQTIARILRQHKKDAAPVDRFDASPTPTRFVRMATLEDLTS